MYSVAGQYDNPKIVARLHTRLAESIPWLLKRLQIWAQVRLGLVWFCKPGLYIFATGELQLTLSHPLHHQTQYLNTRQLLIFGTKSF
jgi:hypothetical protein